VRSGESVVMSGLDETRDPTRRTRLANERTYLAWWRTGLATLAVGVGTGRLIPAVSGGTAWPYQVLGVAFAVVGLAFMVYAYVRQRSVEEALARGEYSPFRLESALAFALLGALLALGTIAIVLFES
jgi:putative membrane protein